MAPELILNCAAYNDVDGAEDMPATAFTVNALAVRSMAAAAERAGATLVHYSTDFVFDGADRATPYTETDAPKPQSVYGMSKLLGEWLAAAAPRAYVLRVESLFGGVGDVDLAAGQRCHLVGAGPPLDGDASELAGGADHHDLHAACFIRASSKTPSQRATTTEATQLPMTFTAVRPMSRI